MSSELNKPLPSDGRLPSRSVRSPQDALLKVLDALGSLKLTVVLFALSMVLVLVGTLAQAEQDMWEVLTQYFKSWVAFVQVKVLFPPSFFPSFTRTEYFTNTISKLVFPFPGGATIGTLLSVNLVAAHLRRFKVQAGGRRLAVGWLVIGVGALMTLGIVLSGNFQDGLQTEPIVSYGMLWWFYKACLLALWLSMLYAFVRIDRSRWVEQRLLLVGTLLLTAVLAWLFYRSDFQLSDSAMRILWQLTKGVGAGVVLLIGSIMVFKRRAGIVVLHMGVGVMMIGVVIATRYSSEERITLSEGETVSYARDLRTTELAFVDTSPEDHNDVAAAPWELLNRSAKREQPLEDPALPVAVRLEKYVPHAPRLERTKPGDSPADKGAGRSWKPAEQRKSAGADADGEVDMPAAYVTLLDKETGEELGTHLVSVVQSFQDEPEKVEVGGKTYDMYLWFKRTYRPFELTLLDVRKDDYVGTNTPKNYSSDIRLVDPSRGEDRRVRIWMNNPLRYANLTFYQSGYDNSTGVEVTHLQVVKNVGWMIPYVSCSIVGVGMFWHFSLTLLRFLRSQKMVAGGGLWPARLATAGIVAAVIMSAMWSGERSLHKTQFDLEAAGRMPVMFEGRVKPLDTLARNTMLVMSGKSSFKDAEGTRQPAVLWLLDLIASDPFFHEEGEAPETAAFKRHPVFRIDNLEVLQTLGLQRRSRFRYALEEFEDQLPKFQDEVKEARELDPLELDVYQRKLIETEKRLVAYRRVAIAFDVSSLALPSDDELNSMDALRDGVQRVVFAMQMIDQRQPPLAVPTSYQDDDAVRRWQCYTNAVGLSELRSLLVERGLAPEVEPDPATAAWTSILRAYAAGDAETFNQQVAGYLAQLKSEPPPEFDAQTNKIEALMNMYAPFTTSMVLYVMAFVVGCLAWLLANNRTVRSVSTTIVVVTLLLHTIGLVARVYVSGRPPVTNLYSSAVFIGWGGVLLGVVLEMLIPLGIGNIIGACSGFSTLLIAGGLAADGDTLTVLQAVLDTQFWLATHVVCITLGYATTFFAGLLGVLYVFFGFFTPALTKNVAKEVTRMIYGILCFAIFFSFIGTVLGGLWADDSWGRFWGWDPKENGALLIVLWNAIVLHARWGGMIRQRGLAVLAIGGNIITAWSWFGVNELGIGLHSYGFTEGVLLRLFMFCVSQMLLIAVGMLPLTWWYSHRAQQDRAVAQPD